MSSDANVASGTKSGADPAPRSSPSGIRAIIFLLFFASGVSALMYEIVWTRLLTLVFGHTVYAVSTVLAAFMAGLALGSFLFGRVVDRRPRAAIDLYAYLEVGIGIYALLFPLLLKTSSPIYMWVIENLRTSPYVVDLIRFSVCVLLLLPATILMGGTLPVLSKFFVRSEATIGWNVGALYAVNTLGAVLGCFLTSFLMIDRFGVSRSIQIGAAINILAGLCAWGMARRRAVQALQDGEEETREAAAPAEGTEKPPERAVLLAIPWLFAASGFAALAYEVFWTRMLVYIVGTDVQAFGIMLSVYLTGLTVGSFLFTKCFSRRGNPVALFVAFEVLIGVFGILSVPILGLVLDHGWRLGRVVGVILPGGGWWATVAVRILRSAAVMFVPTLLMGATFPLVTRIYVHGMKRLSSSIGRLYAMNTVGAILGSFLGGFVLIPALGIKPGILAMGLLNIAIGVVALLLSPSVRRGSPAKPLAIGAILCTTLCLLIAVPELETPLVWSRKQQDEYLLHYYDEGVSTSIAVIEQKPTGVRELNMNGKSITYADYWDFKVQKMLAHLPILLHPDPQDVLIIAFGSGSTSGTAMLYGERTDCVELERAQVKTARFFEDMNHGVLGSSEPQLSAQGTLKNGNFTLNIGDGRNWLLTRNKSYDVISRDTLPPKRSQNLFSVEFYELCKKRLKKGGIACGFLPTDLCPDEDYFRTILATFQQVFEHASLWYVGPEFFILVATDEKLQIDVAKLTERMEVPAIKEDLAIVHLDDPCAFLSCFLMTEEKLREYAEGARIATDDLPIGFVNADERLPDEDASAIASNLIKYRSEILPYLTSLGETDEEAERLRQRLKSYYDASAALIRGRCLHKMHTPGTVARAIAEYQLALAECPEYEDVKFNLARALTDQAGDLSQAGQRWEAIKRLKQATRLADYYPAAYVQLGWNYERLNRPREAEQWYGEALKRSPRGIPLAKERLERLAQMKR